MSKLDSPFFKKICKLRSQNKWAEVCNLVEEYKILEIISDQLNKVVQPFLDDLYICYFYLNNLEKCMEVLSCYKFCSITPHMRKNANYLYNLARKKGYKIIRTYDYCLVPKDKEIIIYYSSFFDDSYMSLLQSNKVYIKKVVHTIGNSHSRFGWQGVVNHSLGQVLCYSFGKEKLGRCDITKFNVKDGETVIFCFGEIDCRNHINKHVTPGNTYQKIIDVIVYNYFEAIKLNIVNSGLKIRTCVFNVVPSFENYNTPGQYFPRLGGDTERKNYVLYFNTKLKEFCLKYGYIFFDVYDKYTDSNGYLSKELSDNNVHILNGIHIKEFMSKDIMLK